MTTTTPTTVTHRIITERHLDFGSPSDKDVSDLIDALRAAGHTAYLETFGAAIIVFARGPGGRTRSIEALRRKHLGVYGRVIAI